MAYYAVRSLLGWVNPKGWRRDAVEDLRVYREHIRASERARYAGLVEAAEKVKLHWWAQSREDIADAVCDIDIALAALQSKEGTDA